MVTTIEISNAGSSNKYPAVFYKDAKKRWLRGFHVAALLLIYKLFGVTVHFDKGKIVVTFKDEAEQYITTLLRINPYSFRKYYGLFDELEPEKVLDELVLTVIADRLSL